METEDFDLSDSLADLAEDNGGEDWGENTYHFPSDEGPAVNISYDGVDYIIDGISIDPPESYDELEEDLEQGWGLADKAYDQWCDEFENADRADPDRLDEITVENARDFFGDRVNTVTDGL